MARTNKFASVNLNDSYGKRDQPSSAAAAHSGNAASSRFPTVGGMLVLSRPGRGQLSNVKPAGSSASRLHGKPNSPSLLSRDLTDNGNNASHLLQGWLNSSHGESHPASDVEPSGSGRSIVLDDTRHSPAISKRDVYAPPALRAMQPIDAGCSVQTSGGGSLNPVNISSTPVEKPSAIIRGEDFPTLQASMARLPTTPHHQKQKDAQLKQREKHQEMKEQRLKLQQLSIQHQLQVDSSQAAADGCPSLRPYGRQGQHLKAGIESKHQNVAVFSPSERSSQPSANESGLGLSLRPQGRAPFLQNNLIVESQQQGPQSEIGSLCLAQRNFESTNIDRGSDRNSSQQNLANNVNKIPSDASSSLAGKDRTFSGGSSGYDNGLSLGLGRDDKHIQCKEHKYSGGLNRYEDKLMSEVGQGGGPTKQVLGIGGFQRILCEREASPLCDIGHGREGLYEPRGFGREPNDWVGRSPYGKLSMEAYSEDNLQVNSVRKEVCIRSSRDVYGQDNKGVHDKDGPMTRALGYENLGVEVRSPHRINLRDNSLSYGKSSYGAKLYSSPNDMGSGNDAHTIKQHSLYASATDMSDTNQDFLTKSGIYAVRPISQLLGGGIAEGSSAKTPFMEKPQVWSGDKKNRFDKWASETQPGANIERLEYTGQKPFNKNVLDSANRGDERIHEEGMGSWAEEEKRKEAARQKLMELEERIARRTAEEKRKVECKGKAMNKKLEEFSISMEDVKDVVLIEHSEESLVGIEHDVDWKEGSPELFESSRLQSFRGLREELFEEHDVAAAGMRTTLNKERKVISWRKEVGNGPMSKLVSSSYAESGGFRRPYDGRTYQLF